MYYYTERVTAFGMNSERHYDEAEMVHFEETVAIYDDLVAANMNLISQIQEQIKNNNEGASMIILCMIAFGLILLRTVSTRNNCMSESQPQKEHRRQELMEYLVHPEQSRHIIAWDRELSLNYVNEYGKLDLLNMHIDQSWKNK